MAVINWDTDKHRFVAILGAGRTEMGQLLAYSCGMALLALFACFQLLHEERRRESERRKEEEEAIDAWQGEGGAPARFENSNVTFPKMRRDRAS